MAIYTYYSTERGVPLADVYPPCCGQTPEVLHWKRKQLTALYCRNIGCENHHGVLCYGGEVAERWEKFRIPTKDLASD